MAVRGTAAFTSQFGDTFTIIVAGRTRELALLRAVGASRRQVVSSVMWEALAVGLLGSLIGLALGAVFAIGLLGAGLFGGGGISLVGAGAVVTLFGRPHCRRW